MPGRRRSSGGGRWDGEARAFLPEQEALSSGRHPAICVEPACRMPAVRGRQEMGAHVRGDVAGPAAAANRRLRGVGVGVQRHGSARLVYQVRSGEGPLPRAV